jgi:hypothetical protein
MIAVIAFTALCAAARADLTAFWRHNPITPEAIADDPVLAGMQSWSVMVTNTDGLFASAGLRAVLPPSSTFYRNINAGNFRPTAAQQLQHPALTFHTYVTAPDETNVIIVGGFPQPLPPASFGGPFDPIPGTFSVSWGDPIGLPTYGPGTYELARLTFSVTLLPTIHAESNALYFSPTQQTVLIPVNLPESEAVVLTLGTSSLLIRSRRRQLC